MRCVGRVCHQELVRLFLFHRPVAIFCRCRNGLVVIVVICTILSLTTTVLNLTVVIVIAKNRTMQNSQAIYKLSLAFSDLVMGVFVFPTFISSLMLTRNAHKLGPPREFEGFIELNGTATNQTATFTDRQMGHFEFSKRYFNFVGFVTSVSLVTSLYCLAVAGFDRLQAVYRPLKYRKDWAKLQAKWLTFVVWIVAILFGSLPWYVPTLTYRLLISFLVAVEGGGALIVYAIAFVIPLVCMWVLSIVTYCCIKKYSKIRRHLTMDSQFKTRSIENRLAKTLSIMVGAFTLSVIPAAILSIVPHFTKSIFYDRPKYLDINAANVYRDAEFAAILFLSCNSLWNFFIYSMRNLEFRKASNVLYSDLAGRLGLTKCWNVTCKGLRRAVHDGRRRLSAIPTITYTIRKKSVGTEIIAASAIGGEASKNSEQSTDDHTALRKMSLTPTANASVATKDCHNGSNPVETAVENGKAESYERINTKNKSRKTTNELASDVAVSSEFNSFVVDVHADRFFVSVIERIAEDAKNQEENQVVIQNKTAWPGDRMQLVERLFK